MDRSATEKVLISVTKHTEFRCEMGTITVPLLSTPPTTEVETLETGPKYLYGCRKLSLSLESFASVELFL